MKTKIFNLTLLILLVGSSLFAQTNFLQRKEYKSNCDGSNKQLLAAEEYDQTGKLIRTARANKKITTYNYDAIGNLISKIHRDSTGKVARFNRIYYNEKNEYTLDTLFNSDSTIHTIFHRRHSSIKNQDIITWDLPQYKGSTIIQTLTLDANNNEVENKTCSSSAECTIIKTTYDGSKKIKMESYRREEMNRNQILYETQTFEYDKDDRLIKISVENNLSNVCSYLLSYIYSK